MSQEDIFINGELLRLRREARGWVLSDLATRACMSVKQIRQLEEGGMSAFYSAAVKATSAKKVGALLGLSVEEIFAQEVSLVPGTVEPEVLVVEKDVSAHDSKQVDFASVAQEDVNVQVNTTTAHTSLTHAANEAPASVIEEPKSKLSLWLIAGLFAAALAVAAYMQPQDESVAEPAPPLQTLPSDASDAASVASAAEVLASTSGVASIPAAASSDVISIQKNALSSASSTPRMGAAVASGLTPSVLHPTGSSLAIPAASVASKSP